MRNPAFFSTLLALFLLSPVVPVHAQEATKAAAAVATPEPAQTLIDAAMKTAKANKKNVFVVFHASWCGWCKRLDEKFFNDPAMGKLMTSHYEIVHLDVSEEGDATKLENPGGEEFLAKMGGQNSGLPFYAVLTPDGKKLTDANRMPSSGNIGYPAAPEEISAFLRILKYTAPKMNDTDRKQVEEHLKKNAPPQSH